MLVSFWCEFSADTLGGRFHMFIPLGPLVFLCAKNGILLIDFCKRELQLKGLITRLWSFNCGKIQTASLTLVLIHPTCLNFTPIVFNYCYEGDWYFQDILILFRILGLTPSNHRFQIYVYLKKNTKKMTYLIPRARRVFLLEPFLQFSEPSRNLLYDSM